MEYSKENMIETEALAERLGISPHTLIQWRFKGIGPPYVKLGKLVRYHVASVDKWIEEQERHSTARTKRKKDVS